MYIHTHTHTHTHTSYLTESEVSLSEREKQYCILMHIYMETRKTVLMNLSARSNRDTENGLVDTEGEVESRMN